MKLILNIIKFTHSYKANIILRRKTKSGNSWNIDTLYYHRTKNSVELVPEQIDQWHRIERPNRLMYKG